MSEVTFKKVDWEGNEDGPYYQVFRMGDYKGEISWARRDKEWVYSTSDDGQVYNAHILEELLKFVRSNKKDYLCSGEVI